MKFRKIIISIIYRQLEEFIKYPIINMPGELGIIFRRLYYSRKFNRCGKKLFIDTGVIFYHPENIEVGDNVSIGKNCVWEVGKELIIGSGTGFSTGYINANHGPVIIGENCLISRGVQIYSGTRKYLDREILIKFQGYFDGKILIKNDVWIGANSYIGSDLIIDNGAVIGAGSVVKQDIKSYAVVAGSPARLIKFRIKSKNKREI